MGDAVFSVRNKAPGSIAEGLGVCAQDWVYARGEDAYAEMEDEWSGK